MTIWTLPLLLALALRSPVLGQDASGEVRRAQVVIDGETLFSVRGVTAHPAERRAREIAGRIRAFAANRNLSTKSLALEDQPGMTLILADGQRLMSVLDEDAAIEQITRTTLAELYRRRIGEAIDEYRRSRRPRLMWLHTVNAMAASAALLFAFIFGRRLLGLVRGGIERRYHARVQGIQERAFQLIKADQIWRALMGLLNVASTVTVLAIVYVYLNYVLALFPWTRGLARSLFALALEPLRTIALGFIGLIPNFAFLAILVLITRYALRIMRLFFDGVAAGTVTLKGFDPEWALPTYRLVRLLAVAFAVVVAYPQIPGSGSDAFKGVSLFIGIIFSLGSSSLIGNFIAGYSMTYRRAFKIGDRVMIGEHVGVVEKMRLLVTHLRTPKNEELVVPNSVILGNEIINYSSMARDQGLILHTTVGIGYETPWRQVEAMLVEAAARTPRLLRHPSPFVLQKSLGDFAVAYEINAYCDTPLTLEGICTDLHRNILDVFNEYGIQIMTPAYEHDPDRPKVVPKEEWYAAPAQPQTPAGRDPPKCVADRFHHKKEITQSLLGITPPARIVGLD
jgi:small-conductance mechanosensitive channel